MSLRSILLASVLIASAARAQETAAVTAAPPTPATPATRMALTGDFIDLGTGHPGAVQGLAAIEIVNRTAFPIVVGLGRGSGRVEPGRSLFVRIEAGAQPLRVSSKDLPEDELAATLELEAGRGYALGIAREELLVKDDPATAVKGSREQAAAAAAAADGRPARVEGKAQPSSEPAAEASKGRRSGRVDVGRKRKKDR